jgi:putative acetyltransferase
MTSSVTLRAEKPGDARAIHALHHAEFKGNAEADLVDEVRETGETVLSLVAEENGKIIGHILFARLILDGAPRAAALGPIAVDLTHQKRGIGGRLIEEGHRLLREMGEKLVFVVGDPAYYSRFGFSREAAAKFDTPYNGPYLMSLALAPDAPTPGKVVYPASYAKFG